MTIKAWHFVGKTLRDGSPVPKDGVWLRYDKPLRAAESAGWAKARLNFNALVYECFEGVM